VSGDDSWVGFFSSFVSFVSPLLMPPEFSVAFILAGDFGEFFIGCGACGACGDCVDGALLLLLFIIIKLDFFLSFS
jgi:hypothetical protein